MRLLYLHCGILSLTEDYTKHVPPYAILSHTRGKDTDEIVFDEMRAGTFIDKTGYKKIEFGGEEAARDIYFVLDNTRTSRAGHVSICFSLKW